MKDLIISAYLAPLTVVCEPSVLSKQNGSKKILLKKQQTHTTFFPREDIEGLQWASLYPKIYSSDNLCVHLMRKNTCPTIQLIQENLALPQSFLKATVRTDNDFAYVVLSTLGR